MGDELHLAAVFGDEEKVRRLLDDGWDVNDKSENGRTPLSFAAMANHIKVADILVSHDADVNRGYYPPLQAAVSHGQVEMVRWLLEHGADPNKRSINYGGTALQTPAVDSNTEIVKLLLAYGADPAIKNESYSKNGSASSPTLESGIVDGMNAYFRRGNIADSGPVYLSCKVTPGQDNTKTKVENIQVSGTEPFLIHTDDSSLARRGHFLKERDDSEYAAFLQSLSVAVNSVGLIYSPAVSGSGFRVGSCYVMTNYHVVQGIMRLPSDRLPQPADIMKLIGPGVYILFDFNQPHAQRGPVQSYSLDPVNPLRWYDITLDIAVVKLSVPSEVIIPVPALCNFEDPHSVYRDIWILGHPTGGPKKFEKCELTSSGQIHSAQTWSTIEGQPNLYVVCDDPRYLTYNAAFEHGASGSPCLIPGPFNVAAVAAVHTRGVPQLNSRAEIPRDKTFEQGVRVTSICKSMRDTNPRLCKEIFGDHYVSLAVAAP